jgi:exodeoxyribonuclease VII large subunit
MFNPVKSVQTVSEFTASLKGLIETSHPFVNLQGEVSNLRIPYSGHMYFILKDDKAQIRAVLFKSQRRFLHNEFKDGDEIICRGRITVYEPRGDYQIIVDSVQKAGSGLLHLQFTALKEKLEQEGLFAGERKKQLPFFPRKICLITSSTGAAVHDFLEIGLQKNPTLQIEIIATPMQGDQAPYRIKKSLETACSRHWAEIVVLCRGGGSVEDLAAFNDEDLARAIADASLPVVSAIGHEVDFTIADFVADLRAPTPTAAADLIIPDKNNLKKKIADHRKQLQHTIENLFITHKKTVQNQIKFLGDPSLILSQQHLKINYLRTQLDLIFAKDIPHKQEILTRLTMKLQTVSPEKTVASQTKQFANIQRRLITVQKKNLQQAGEELRHHLLMLDTLSPLAVLRRGYSLTTTLKNTLVTSVQDVKNKDIVAVKIADGVIEAEICRIIPDKKQVGH